MLSGRFLSYLKKKRLVSFVVTRCTTCCNSLSVLVIQCQPKYHPSSLLATRCITRMSFYKQSASINQTIICHREWNKEENLQYSSVERCTQTLNKYMRNKQKTTKNKNPNNFLRNTKQVFLRLSGKIAVEEIMVKFVSEIFKIFISQLFCLCNKISVFRGYIKIPGELFFFFFFLRTTPYSRYILIHSSSQMKILACVYLDFGKE